MMYVFGSERVISSADNFISQWLQNYFKSLYIV